MVKGEWTEEIARYGRRTFLVPKHTPSIAIKIDDAADVERFKRRTWDGDLARFRVVNVHVHWAACSAITWLVAQALGVATWDQISGGDPWWAHPLSSRLIRPVTWREVKWDDPLPPERSFQIVTARKTADLCGLYRERVEF